MSDRIVYLNGKFVAERDAKISIFDTALQMGDMVYEVTRTIRHQPYRLREHLQRLRYSMTALEINPQLTDDELAQITQEVLARNLPTEAEDVDWNVIHSVSNGPASAFRAAFGEDEQRPTVVVACYPLAEKMASLAARYQSGVDLVIPSQHSLPSAWFDAGIKCRSRAHFQLANQQANRIRPHATAVLLDPDGFITEGTSGNVFFVRDDELLTPTSRNILPGITRGVVLDLARRLGIVTCECDITATAAAAAQEMFLTSTSIGIVPARSFETYAIPEDVPGPVTRRLSDALWQELGLDFATQAREYSALRSSSA